jgi:peptidoglycan/xylan/chitin deacetylase (PgdA/CDA1 family)
VSVPLVLCYHAVADGWPSTLAVSPAQLERHAATLSRRGYTALTFAEAERRRRAGTLPRRTVVFTFDDAFASVGRARIVLDRFAFPATVFALGAYGDGRALEWPEIKAWTTGPHRTELASLTWDELRDLRDGGWEVGAHTMTHPSLPSLDDEGLDREIAGSRAVIEREVGICETFAYPFGRLDDRVAAAVGRAGFLAACSLSGTHPADEPLRRPRVGIYPRDTGLRLWLKLSPLVLRLRRSSALICAERLIRGRRAPGRSGSLV